MSRRSTGQVIERSGPRGKVFALRFHAYVRRGIWVWRRRRGRTGLDERATTFGPFASRLVAERKGEVSDSQIVNQEWTLGHLLPYFADWQLGDIDIEAVDAYRHHKVREAEVRRTAIERR